METFKLIKINETQVIPSQQTEFAALEFVNQLISITDDITATREQISLINSQSWWKSNHSKTENIKVLAQNVLKINNCICFQNKLIQHMLIKNDSFLTVVWDVLQNIEQSGRDVSGIEHILKILSKEIDLRKKTEIKFGQIDQNFQLTDHRISEIQGSIDTNAFMLKEAQDKIDTIEQTGRDEKEVTAKRFDQIDQNFQLTDHRISEIQGSIDTNAFILKEVQDKIDTIEQTGRDEKEVTAKRFDQIDQNFQLTDHRISEIQGSIDTNAFILKEVQDKIDTIEQTGRDEKEVTAKRFDEINQSFQLTDHRISEIQSSIDTNAFMLKEVQDKIDTIEQTGRNEKEVTAKRFDQINQSFQLTDHSIKSIKVQNNNNSSQLRKVQETIRAIGQNIAQLKTRQLAFEKEFTTFRDHFINEELRNLYTNTEKLNEKMKHATRIQQQQKKLFIGFGVILFILIVLSFLVKYIPLLIV